jgi:hypothetical protein
MLQLITHFAQTVTTCDPNKTFFGLPVWYKYLNPTQGPGGSCDFSHFSFPNDLLLIGLAAVDILLRVAGLVAVGFLVYAAFNFITSQGNPEDAAKARGTAINALIGLLLAMFAIVMVSFIGKSLK